MIIYGVILILLSTILTSVAVVFLKLGLEKFCLSIIKNLKNKNLMIAIFLYVLSLILFIPSLMFADLSFLYPIGSFGFVFTALLSQRYLKEKMNLYKWTAIALIIIGVSLIGLGYST